MRNVPSFLIAVYLCSGLRNSYKPLQPKLSVAPYRFTFKTFVPYHTPRQGHTPPTFVLSPPFQTPPSQVALPPNELMSTTLTETAAIPSTAPTFFTPAQPPMTDKSELSAESHCPQCGHEVAALSEHDVHAAQQRIQELEARVKFLTGRAAETADKLADYEDEIRTLRAQSQHNTHTKESFSISSTSSGPGGTLTTTSDSPSVATATVTTDPTTQSSPPRPHTQPTGTSTTRLGTIASFLPYRRQTAANTNQSSTNLQAVTAGGAPLSSQHLPPASPNMTSELQNELTREKSLRKAAESQLSQANSELEELTVQLFSQANEMVAQERKARAKLEERVAVLERRDGEKRKRLERLEKAIERVERVRNLVG